MPAPVILRGAFDDLRARDFRYLELAAARGPVRLELLSDAAIRARGRWPRFPQDERRYLLEAIRWVESVTLTDEPGPGPEMPAFTDARLAERPGPADETGLTGRPLALVTGCYDWLHSGHIRFFEEAAAFGELVVALGSDATIRGLKGEGHPLFPAAARRYMVGAIRHVRLALVATGTGRLDAEPEARRIKPAFWIVNEDGDRPEKRAICERMGIAYRVLARAPKPGLPARQSTALRGF